MTNDTAYTLASKYLAEFDRASKLLPLSERARLREQIREHFNDALAGSVDAAKAQLTIDELGTPAEVVAAASTQRPALIARVMLLRILQAVAIVCGAAGLAGVVFNIIVGGLTAVGILGTVLVALSVLIVWLCVRAIRRQR